MLEKEVKECMSKMLFLEERVKWLDSLLKSCVEGKKSLLEVKELYDKGFLFYLNDKLKKDYVMDQMHDFSDELKDLKINVHKKINLVNED